MIESSIHIDKNFCEAQRLSFSLTTVTLFKIKVINWYETIQFNDFYDHIEFHRKWSINILKEDFSLMQSSLVFYLTVNLTWLSECQIYQAKTSPIVTIGVSGSLDQHVPTVTDMAVKINREICDVRHGNVALQSICACLYYRFVRF